MKRTDLEDLRRTVEQVRSEVHPDLDADFTDSVVTAEEQNPEDDAEAMRAIESALTKSITLKGMS